uniref:hypothetical protein n=1 Tax=Alloprevotella sp. TaxID=1872471 RepID=UPI003FED5F75
MKALQSFSKENEPFLGGFAPPATGRTSAVFSMVLDLFLLKYCVHKDTARYVFSNSKPLELLYQVNVDFFQSQIIKQYVYRFFS